MIETLYLGRLGNKLFQYTLSRILAEELGFALPATLPWFLNAGPLEGAEYNEPIQEITGHVFDLAATIADRTPRRVVVNGYFQRYEYFAPFAQRIRGWLSLDGHAYRRPAPGTLVVHVRGGDLYDDSDAPIHPAYHPLPFRHYARLIEANTDATALAVVCESPHDPVARKIARRFGGELVSQTPFEDFYFIAHSNEFIMSMSTFAWWAGWLSSARRIYAPLIGMWHPDHERVDVDLIVHEPRYTHIDLGARSRWEATVDQVADVLAD